MVKNFVCYGMDFEQFKPCVVLYFLNFKGDFDEFCDVRNSECMVNGRDGSLVEDLDVDLGEGCYISTMIIYRGGRANENFEGRRKKGCC